MEILKVSSKSNSSKVAGAIANIFREKGTVELQTIGAGSLNQAIKALCIARGFLAPSGTNLVCIPAFTDIIIDGEEKTGITNEMVAEAREVWKVFEDFANFIKEDDILVGYNCMSFDSKFLTKAGKISNIIIKNEYFDVMNYVKKFKYKLNYTSKTLISIGETLNIINPNAHRALADAVTTAKVYLKLLEIDN